ncbi:MAG: DUF296 domain-containing protein [Candidatus Thorarchaeota archaeon]|nr:DUF296 domain-containing protein [Candidatus Thorarchaeota archaeon]
MVEATASKPARVLVCRLSAGEDILNSIAEVARRHDVKAAYFMLIGAIRKARLGYFDVHGKQYTEIHIERDLEVASCTGNIARLEDGEVIVHAHAVVADGLGSCTGGHVLQGCEVSVTAELFMTELQDPLVRTRDEVTGLNLLDLKRR